MRKSTSVNYLWVRDGACSDYEKFDGIDDWLDRCAVETLGGFIAWKTLSGATGHVCQGLETTYFCDDDYISLFWGDDDAQATRSLNALEKKIIENRLCWTA